MALTKWLSARPPGGARGRRGRCGTARRRALGGCADARQSRAQAGSGERRGLGECEPPGAGRRRCGARQQSRSRRERARAAVRRPPREPLGRRPLAQPPLPPRDPVAGSRSGRKTTEGPSARAAPRGPSEQPEAAAAEDGDGDDAEAEREPPGPAPSSKDSEKSYCKTRWQMIDCGDEIKYDLKFLK
nr:elongin BC and Polycomb repressive complex 2-associated protein-like [Kogia breviceps]